jgi:hypothetical protein
LFLENSNLQYLVVVGGELVSSSTTTLQAGGSSSTKQIMLLLNKTSIVYEASYYIIRISLLYYKVLSSLIGITFKSSSIEVIVGIVRRF